MGQVERSCVKNIVRLEATQWFDSVIMLTKNFKYLFSSICSDIIFTDIYCLQNLIFRQTMS